MSTSPAPAHHPSGLAGPSAPGQRLGELQEDEHPGQRREPRGHEEGKSEPPGGADGQADEQPPQERPEHEPQAEGHADQPHPPRPVLGRRDVGHVGLGHQDVAARGPVEHPGQQHHGEVVGEAQDQERDRRARLADDQERPAAVAVAQPAQDRPATSWQSG